MNFATTLLVGPGTRSESVGAENDPQAHVYTQGLEASRQDELDEPVVFEQPGQSYRLAAEIPGQAVSATSEFEAFQGMPTFVGYNTVGQPGFPLPVPSDGSDATYARVYQEDWVQDPASIVPVERLPLLTEVSRGQDFRPSVQPVSTNDMERPWDRVLGAWPWSGDKAMQERPVASTPNYYGDPIPNAAPSPGGSQPTYSNTASLTPQRMTFRLPPEPWDSTYTSLPLSPIPGVQQPGE